MTDQLLAALRWLTPPRLFRIALGGGNVTPERRLDGRRDKTRISRRHTPWSRTSDKIGPAVRAGADTSGPKIGGLGCGLF